MSEDATVRLQPGHGWRARPGCKIFVADRGAVRFDFPETWAVAPDEANVKLYDHLPPHDDCCLTVSYFHLPQIDWSGLSLGALLDAAVREGDRPAQWSRAVQEMRRLDLELVWGQVDFIDAADKREGRSRICMARRSNLQCLLTLDYWVTDAATCEAAWDIVVETLELGEFVAGPTRGPVLS